MANLPETPQWQEGIYQIETTDRVIGGPDGKINAVTKQLADRTAYLKDASAAAADAAAAADGKADQALQQMAAIEVAAGSAQSNAGLAQQHMEGAQAALALTVQARNEAQAAAGQSSDNARLSGQAAGQATQKASEASASATAAVSAASQAISAKNYIRAAAEAVNESIAASDENARRAEEAANSATGDAGRAETAANQAVSLVGNVSKAVLSYPDYATALAAAATLPDGQIIDALAEQERYRVQAGALVLVTNLDQTKLDLANATDPAKGAAMVGYKGETLAGVIARHEGLSVYVESFRKEGAITRSDSNTIRAALAFIQATQAGRISRLIFEAGRIYTYDRTAELATINDLTIDLNGATLVRASAATTRTTLAQAAGTGQSTLYLAAIPANWEVGDYLTAYTDNTNANTSKNVVVIKSIAPAGNRVTVNGGFGPVGALTTILPVGTKVAKKFQAFTGRPSSTEAGIPTSGGVNSNVHIINGTIDGNSSNQENNSWFFNSEILLHGRASSVRNMRFRNTAGECIVGHGLRVDGNEFRNLKGSAFHLSMHDDSAALSSASWFTNNVTKGTNLATQAVNGHCEGAVTFSWGAGRLIVSGNEFLNGTESVLGAFGPANESANPDKWLIFTDNICRNANRLFYAIASPAEGIVVTDNVLVDCESATFQMEILLSSKTNIVGGNVCVGNSAVAGAYRATNGVFGTASATISQLKLLAGSDVPGMNMSHLSEAVSATTGPKPFHAFVMPNNSSGGGLSFFSPSGMPAGDFFANWTPSTKRFELLGNAAGGGVRVGIKRAFLNLDATTQTYPNNAAAVAGGLLAGDVYQTSTGQLMRVL